MARAADEGECTINTRSTDRVFVFEVLGRIGRYDFSKSSPGNPSYPPLGKGRDFVSSSIFYHHSRARADAE